jgi:hypothetical protein
MSTIDDMLARSWRIASEQFRDAAQSASVPDMKHRLANRALTLAQQAEAFERQNIDEKQAAFVRQECTRGDSGNPSGDLSRE